MSIRWKLFLALFLVATGATALVLVVAEDQFEEWVKEQVRERFDAEVEGLLESRRERLEPLRELCLKVADLPELKASLRGEGKQEMRGQFLRKFQELREAEQGPGRSRLGEGGERPGAGQRAGGRSGGGLGDRRYSVIAQS